MEELNPKVDVITRYTHIRRKRYMLLLVHLCYTPFWYIAYYFHPQTLYKVDKTLSLTY